MEIRQIPVRAWFLKKGNSKRNALRPTIFSAAGHVLLD